MTALSFTVLGARPEPHAAVPTIMFRLGITEATGAEVHAAALRCQIRIEPQRRRYTPEEELACYELFGDTPQWGDSLHPFLWSHVSMAIAGFVGATELDLPLQCTYDFDIAGAKYLHALTEGEVPLLFLFSGTVFSRGSGGFAAEPIAWSEEAQFRLPVSVWREMMDLYFPNSGWLRLHRDTIDRLQYFKARRAIPSWDLALDQLLTEVEGEPR